MPQTKLKAKPSAMNCSHYPLVNINNNSNNGNNCGVTDSMVYFEASFKSFERYGRGLFSIFESDKNILLLSASFLNLESNFP